MKAATDSCSSCSRKSGRRVESQVRFSLMGSSCRGAVGKDQGRTSRRTATSLRNAFSSWSILEGVSAARVVPQVPVRRVRAGRELLERRNLRQDGAHRVLALLVGAGEDRLASPKVLGLLDLPLCGLGHGFTLHGSEPIVNTPTLE